MTDIIESLRGLASETPERMVQVFEDLRVQWSSMSDEQKAQAKAQILALRGRIIGLGEEQFQAVLDKLASVGERGPRP